MTLIYWINTFNYRHKILRCPKKLQWTLKINNNISIWQLNLEKKVAIIGIAKRLEEIFKPNDKLPLYIDKKSETLKLIQQLRNEAHRFAINFHRDIRSKDALKSGSDDLVGIGPILKDKLLKKYKSFVRLKEVEEDELIKFLGKNRGRSIFNQLRN